MSGEMFDDQSHQKCTWRKGGRGNLIQEALQRPQRSSFHSCLFWLSIKQMRNSTKRCLNPVLHPWMSLYCLSRWMPGTPKWLAIMETIYRDISCRKLGIFPRQKTTWLSSLTIFNDKRYLEEVKMTPEEVLMKTMCRNSEHMLPMVEEQAQLPWYMHLVKSCTRKN